MSKWHPIETAPRNGTPILLAYSVSSNDVLSFVPWEDCPVVIGWWHNLWNDNSGGWEICFMYDGEADTEGFNSQFYKVLPAKSVSHWQPLPAHPRRPETTKFNRNAYQREYMRKRRAKIGVGFN